MYCVSRTESSELLQIKSQRAHAAATLWLNADQTAFLPAGVCDERSLPSGDGSYESDGVSCVG